MSTTACERDQVFVSAQVSVIGNPERIEAHLKEFGGSTEYSLNPLADNHGVAIAVKETDLFKEFNLSLEPLLTHLMLLIKSGDFLVPQVTMIMKSDQLSAWLLPPSFAELVSRLDVACFVSFEPLFCSES